MSAPRTPGYRTVQGAEEALPTDLRTLPGPVRTVVQPDGAYIEARPPDPPMKRSRDEMDTRVFTKAAEMVFKAAVRAESEHGHLPTSLDRCVVLLMEEVGEVAEEVLEVGRMERAKEPHAIEHHRHRAIEELAQVAALSIMMIAKIQEEME